MIAGTQTQQHAANKCVRHLCTPRRHTHDTHTVGPFALPAFEALEAFEAFEALEAFVLVMQVISQEAMRQRSLKKLRKAVNYAFWVNRKRPRHVTSPI